MTTLNPLHTAVILAKAGIQYASAYRLYHRRLRITGSSAGACHRAAIRPTRWRTMTAEGGARRRATRAPSHSRGASARVMLSRFRPMEGVGNAGRPMHPQPVCMVICTR